MEEVMELFKGETCEGAVAACAAAFVLGALFATGVCLLAKGSKPKAETVRRARRPQRAKGETVRTPPADGSIEIYVGNLSYDLTEEQLMKEFAVFGKVNSARIIVNKFNGKSKGFGFVHMPNRDEVAAAVKALDEKEILGRKMKCNVAKNAG
jgi:RNA recognition motif-containing protein